jgi:FAD:protein FMN transferase
MLTIELDAMGCRGRAVLDADGTDAQAALDRLPAWLAARERVLSRFDSGSALMRLNAEGSAELVDDVLWQAIDVALDVAAATDGLVTPTILTALEAAGYDRSYDDLERDRVCAVASARTAPDWRSIERDETRRWIRLPPNMRLDLGGTAKGWSADVAAQSLATFGPALVDLGGDIAMSHNRRSPWPIAIADPLGSDRPLDVVLLAEGGIATSGRDYRRWMRSGHEQHHIIDPRTGAPAATDVVSVTVLGPSALAAETAAKRMFLAGSIEGLAWLETQGELAALVVREDAVVLRSARFAHYAWREVA